MKEYKFIGNSELLKLVNPHFKGFHMSSPSDITAWITNNKQKFDSNNEIIATYIIDLEFNLLVNDRRSEHVVCANGKNVLSAGEITFEKIENNRIIVSQITNLSTGYCPSPKSWDAVQTSLNKIGLKFPDFFSTAFEFRVCKVCGWTNVIKDNYFVCANFSCQNELNNDEN